MNRFYRQALFSLLVLTGFSVALYGYESLDAQIQKTFYDGAIPSVDGVSEVVVDATLNDIDERILVLLERQSELVVEAERYARIYGDNGFFGEVSEALKNHLGFVQVLYGLPNQQFPVLAASFEVSPLVGDTTPLNEESDGEEFEELVRFQINEITRAYADVSQDVTEREEKVLLSFVNLVIEEI